MLVVVQLTNYGDDGYADGDDDVDYGGYDAANATVYVTC